MESLFHLTTLQIFLFSALSLFLYELFGSLIAIRKKRADLADIAWGFGFVLIAWVSLGLGHFSWAGLLVNLLVTLWALRLSVHIYKRNRNREEDFRYQNMKKDWGKNFRWRIFSKVFLLQGFILYIVGMPILWLHTHPQQISLSTLGLGVFLWLGGFLIETISDMQLSAFKKDPKNRGKLLSHGLWSYCRHPNFLGEIIQWWAIWVFAATLPFGWALAASPLLITFLIIKVSGVAPLEAKMAQHPGFKNYAKKTPCLFPPSLINGLLYFICWTVSIFYGAKGAFWIPLGSALICLATQIYLFYRWDQNSLLIAFPLFTYSVVLGSIQEMGFIHFKVLGYPQTALFPPIWLLSLYPLFSLTLNSSFSFLNRNLCLAFIIGGGGALISYISGENIGGLTFFPLSSYPILFCSWGSFLTILVLLNRKLIELKEKQTHPKLALTVFFDGECPVCSREMKWLKKRKQTGTVHYACPASNEDLKKWTRSFTYRDAMQTIHAIDDEGKIYKGVHALAALYARTDLPFLAVVLESPGFLFLFKAMYAVWAKVRRFQF